jgi:hypothetical protein
MGMLDAMDGCKGFAFLRREYSEICPVWQEKRNCNICGVHMGYGGMGEKG